MLSIRWLSYLSVLLMLTLAAAACSSNDDDDDDVTTNDDDSTVDDDDITDDDDDSTVDDDDTTDDDDDSTVDDDDDDDVPRTVPTFNDNQLRVGMAKLDVSPILDEVPYDMNKDDRWGDFLPFVDENGNLLWDHGEPMSYGDTNLNGEYDRGEPLLDAEASGNPMVYNGQEPFVDGDDDGKFEPIFIGGFGGGRAAQSIHDPIMAIATVFSYNAEYVAVVTIDLTGIEAGRTRAMAANLDAEGFDGRHLIVCSSHSHQAPDTIGIWGINELTPGTKPEYLEYLETAIPEVVMAAVAALEPAEIWGGQTVMRDFNPWLSHPSFGGVNPHSDRFIGLTNDIRDPMIVDDILSIMQFRRPEDGSVIGTFTNWSGHPEVVGDENTGLSADFNYYLRQRLEQMYGGIAHATPSDVGGMQSALGGTIPLVDEAGQWVMEDDGAGGTRPMLIHELGYDFARSNGYILADAAKALLDSREAPLPVNGLALQKHTVTLAFNNPLLFAGVVAGVIDVPEGFLRPAAECGAQFGCGDANLWMLRIEPSIQVGTVPGELFPELFLGPPADEDFNDPRPNRWFPRHNAADEMSQHADPYVIEPAIKDAFTAETINIVIGLAEAELGYMMPEADYLFPFGDEGDHYEETNSMGNTAGAWVSQELRAMAEDANRGKLPVDQ